MDPCDSNLERVVGRRLAAAILVLLAAAAGYGWYSAPRHGVPPDPGRATEFRVPGDAAVGGSVYVAGTKNFRIDHPLDPENRYLLHFAAEGPEPFNLYAGNVELDGRGRAAVELPAWFEAINRDFRYQLTPIGAPAPGLHVSDRLRDNRFAIAGGAPGQTVSWQVLALRDDRTIRRLAPTPELDKPAHMKGSFVDPLAWGADVVDSDSPNGGDGQGAD